MSDAIIDALKKENDDLKSQITQGGVNFNNVLVNLEATKQMLNEAMNSILQLRTGNIMIQNNIKQATDKALADKQIIDDLNKKLADLSQKGK